MATEAQQFKFMSGGVNVSNFKKFCKDEKIADPKKAVFIFPGNDGHHGGNNSLFSIKSGGGLAKAADELGNAGIATLSLPTVGVPQLSPGQAVPKLASDAVADLWKAAGFGLNIVLPVRPKDNNDFFPAGCKFDVNSKDFEPSFWGSTGINTTPNVDLAKYYFDELKKLQDFVALSDALKQTELEKMKNSGNPSDKAFYAAYQKGVEAQTQPSPWFDSKTELKASQKSTKPVDDVEDLVEKLGPKVGLNFIPKPKDAAGNYHYQAGPVSLQVDKQGSNWTASVDRFDEAALVKMIKMFSEKMTANGDMPRQLSLSGSPEAIAIMESECKNAGITVVSKNANNPHQKNQETQNPDPDSKQKTKLTVEDDEPSESKLPSITPKGMS